MSHEVIVAERAFTVKENVLPIFYIAVDKAEPGFFSRFFAFT